jgi:hypothetical protein
MILIFNFQFSIFNFQFQNMKPIFIIIFSLIAMSNNAQVSVVNVEKKDVTNDMVNSYMKMKQKSKSVMVVNPTMPAESEEEGSTTVSRPNVVTEEAPAYSAPEPTRTEPKETVAPTVINNSDIVITDTELGQSYVIVGSSPDPEKAQAQVNQLVKKGFKNTILLLDNATSKFRVCVGHANTTDAAKINSIKSKAKSIAKDAWVLPF